MLTMQSIRNRVTGTEMIIQRYAVGLWPQIQGEVPFILRGPNWNGRHVFKVALESLDFKGLGPDEIRLIVAEAMLKEGFCCAFWPVELETCAPEDERLALAIRQCADEIPKVSEEWPISLGAWELLDGMSTVEHYRHLLLFDSVVLESMQITNG